jgi:hypothetical protein
MNCSRFFSPAASCSKTLPAQAHAPYHACPDPDLLWPTAVRGLACPNVAKIDALSDTTPAVSSRTAAALISRIFTALKRALA